MQQGPAPPTGRSVWEKHKQTNMKVEEGGEGGEPRKTLFAVQEISAFLAAALSKPEEFWADSQGLVGVLCVLRCLRSLALQNDL